MKTKIAIYLAGSIKKGHENPQESFWTENDISSLKLNLNKFDVSFLNPAFRMDDLSDHLSIFGRDMTQVFCSNFVLVDARDRRGLGVGAEMMWAKVNRIPVVTWSPKNSHYNKDEATILGVPVKGFIHPFVASLSDKIVDNLAEAASWISQAISNPNSSYKGIDHMSIAMQYYRDNQLEHDQPMKELLSCQQLQKRLNRQHPI